MAARARDRLLPGYLPRQHSWETYAAGYVAPMALQRYGLALTTAVSCPADARRPENGEVGTTSQLINARHLPSSYEQAQPKDQHTLGTHGRDALVGTATRLPAHSKRKGVSAST